MAYAMSLNAIYSKLIAAANLAANANEIGPINLAISDVQMNKCEAEDYKFQDINTAYELVYEYERVLVQYRWYDTSKAFSIRPDMNIYLFRHTLGDSLLAEQEIRFLDKS